LRCCTSRNVRLTVVARRSAIEVQGVKELTRQLRKMDDGTVKELKSIHIESANIVYRNAMPRVPVRSGKLKSTMRVSGSTRSGSVRAGGKRSAPYAGPIHFGWPNRPNMQKSWYGGPIRPNTFLYDALDARRSAVEDLFFRRVSKLAEKAGLNPQ
jgi:hypothetical protein